MFVACNVYNIHRPTLRATPNPGSVQPPTPNSQPVSPTMKKESLKPGLGWADPG